MRLLSRHSNTVAAGTGTDADSRHTRERPGFQAWALTGLLGAAIVLGSGLGASAPAIGQRLGGWTDGTLLFLMCLLLLEVRLGDLRRWRAAPRFLLVAWTANFVAIPLVGFAIASLFLADQPLLFAGLLIYFLAPCTDWFLGFTRLAGGNTALGAALIPVNLVTQLVLFPMLLLFVAHTSAPFNVAAAANSVWQWFLLPALVSAGLRVIGRWLLPPEGLARLLRGLSASIPVVIAVLIVEIFAANIGTILGSAGAFGLILAAVVIFFVATYLLSDVVSRLARLAYPEHALLTMTMAARNAPMMLALTMVALPGEPLVHAAIVIGMLVEFPHLTAIRHLLLRRRAGSASRP